MAPEGRENQNKDITLIERLSGRYNITQIRIVLILIHTIYSIHYL